jgi:hypothetical protein
LNDSPPAGAAPRIIAVSAGYFTKAELKQIISKRQDFEYALKRRAALKQDFYRCGTLHADACMHACTPRCSTTGFIRMRAAWWGCPSQVH